MILTQYQYLTPKKSSKILSLASIFLNSDFSGLSTLSLRNWTFLRSLRLMALLLSLRDSSRMFRCTSWLLASCPAGGERCSIRPVPSRPVPSRSVPTASLILISGREFTEELTFSMEEKVSSRRGEESLAVSVFLGSLLLSLLAEMIGLVACSAGLACGIMGGRMLGVVRLIFCFLLSGSAGLAGTSLGGAGFSSSWLPASSHRFFLGEGLVTRDLLALRRFSLELVRCIFSSLSTSCFFEFRNSSYLRATGSGSGCFRGSSSGGASGGWMCEMTVLGAGIWIWMAGLGASWCWKLSGLTFSGMEMLVSNSSLRSSRCGPLNSCTLKSASSPSPAFDSSCGFSGCWCLNFCMDSSWLISSRTFLLTCWLPLSPPATHLMVYSTGGRSGTASQVPRSLKQRASKGCSTNAENCSQRAERAMMDLLISSSLVCILEQILTMRMRQAKKPSCEALMARRNWLRSAMRAMQLPTVISMRLAWQKRYLRYSSNTLFSELKMRKNSFSTILCTIDSAGNLNSSETCTSMYFTRFTLSTTFREHSSSDMLKISSSLEWYSENGCALLRISVTLGMRSMTIFGNGWDQRHSWLRLLRSAFCGSSALKEERQQQRMSQPTMLATASEMLPPSMKISTTRATFSWLVMISSMLFPSAIRQYFSMISTSTSPMFSTTVSWAPSPRSFRCRSQHSRSCSQSWRTSCNLRATRSGGALLFLVRSRLRQSSSVLTTAFEQQCFASRASGCCASQIRSIVSLYLLFQRIRLNCEKYPHRSGSSSPSVPRNSKKAFTKKVRWVVGSTLKKELITHVVLVSTISMASRGSLNFLLSLSDSSGASVMYFINSLGMSREFAMYQSSLGWQALSRSRNSGYSRSCWREGCDSTSASSRLVESLQVLYQLMAILKL